MSNWSNAGNATLGEVIAYLKQVPADQIVERGFCHPHSYRGYYEDLAFEPYGETTVGEMLACAESALGRTFVGYKGGEYTMTNRTDCWLAEYGNTGVPIVVPGEYSIYELPRKDADATARKDG